MNPTVTRPLPARQRVRLGWLLAAIVGTVALVAVFVAVAPAFRSDAPVRRVTIENPTVYSVNVEVSAGGRGGWLDLGAVDREGAKTVEQVTDQGPRWTFRFSYGGVGAGDLTVPRTDLAAAGWRLTIPETVGQRLHDAGLSPSAR